MSLDLRGCPRRQRGPARIDPIVFYYHILRGAMSVSDKQIKVFGYFDRKNNRPFDSKAPSEATSYYMSFIRVWVQV